MDEVYVCLSLLDVCKGVLEYSGLVWCNKCSILEMLETAKLHAHEMSKYQNLSIKAL